MMSNMWNNHLIYEFDIVGQLHPSLNNKQKTDRENTSPPTLKRETHQRFPFLLCKIWRATKKCKMLNASLKNI